MPHERRYGHNSKYKAWQLKGAATLWSLGNQWQRVACRGSTRQCNGVVVVLVIRRDAESNWYMELSFASNQSAKLVLIYCVLLLVDSDSSVAFVCCMTGICAIK